MPRHASSTKTRLTGITVDPEVAIAARKAARKAGLTFSRWLERAILVSLHTESLPPAKKKNHVEPRPEDA